MFHSAVFSTDACIRSADAGFEMLVRYRKMRSGHDPPGYRRRLASDDLRGARPFYTTQVPHPPLNAFQRTCRQIFGARKDSGESTAMQVNGQGAWPLTSVAQSPIPEALAIMPRVNGQEIVPRAKESSARPAACRTRKRRENRAGFLVGETPPTELNAFRNAVKSAAGSFIRVTTHLRIARVGRFFPESAVFGRCNAMPIGLPRQFRPRRHPSSPPTALAASFASVSHIAHGT